MGKTDETQLFNYEPIFVEGKEKKQHSLKTLSLLYTGQFKNIFLSFFFFLIKHSPVWILPIITANIINIATYPDQHSFRDLWVQFGIAAIVIAQNLPSHILHISHFSRASRHVEAALRSTLIHKLQHLSMAFHSELRTGTLQAKILRDVENIEILSKQIMFAFSAAITNVVVAIGITAFYSLQMTFFFAMVIPVGIIVVFVFRKRLRLRNREFRKQIETMSGEVAETVEMIPVTRAHGLEKVEINKANETLKTLKGKGYRLDITEAFFGSSSWVMFQILQALCLIFSASLAMRGEISIGEVVMYQAYFTQILMAVNQIIVVYPQLAKGYESIISISEILSSKEIEEYEGALELQKINGSFEFQHVHFQYKDTEKHVLDDFNLSIKAGECIAFVGESGVGKSTVLSMLVGFYRPTEGRILVDGIPFDQLDMISYRQKLAVVPQNTILFSGSIRDNIRYGLENVSDEEIQKVIEMANLQDVIDELPDGLDTLIGEHGGKLSGGQRQRIAIARAMIRKPEIIILDEATSALDNQSEFRVQQALQELIKGKTTFIVAHRLSTIRDADRIVVMSNGQCQEVGSFEELMEKKGAFYELRKMQM